jgi:hypothetical protein
MPGRRVNRTQVAKYMEHRKELEQEAAAAKVGISVRSARRIERADGLPSTQETRQWRTRADPLSRWWDSDIGPLLATTPALNAVTILEELQRRYPTEVSPVLLRTLQRRLRQWRAAHGAEREVYFAQEHPPGRLGLSDFTDWIGGWIIACINLPWPIPVGGTSKLCSAARASKRWPGGCRMRCGNWAACQKNIGPTRCRQRFAI